MQVDHFREQVRFYCQLLDKTQQDLAKAIGLAPSVLSHKLHGTRNKGLTHSEARSIVKSLVEWGAMQQQAEVRALLGLMECPDLVVGVQAWEGMDSKVHDVGNFDRAAFACYIEGDRDGFRTEHGGDERCKST